MSPEVMTVTSPPPPRQRLLALPALAALLVAAYPHPMPAADEVIGVGGFGGKQAPSSMSLQR
ncbi:hypothetical protein, partial [Verrucomicrobium spinosum]|uniref:hypothetical protein n=1 Tax=Verrucomicrobium spinosum TaxID=2736 RepID=UPI001C478248